MNAVPEGWRQRQRLSPFNALVGPLGGASIVRASAVFARSEKE
jgi:hypothetical protein